MQISPVNKRWINCNTLETNSTPGPTTTLTWGPWGVMVTFGKPTAKQLQKLFNSRWRKISAVQFLGTKCIFYSSYFVVDVIQSLGPIYIYYLFSIGLGKCNRVHSSCLLPIRWHVTWYRSASRQYRSTLKLPAWSIFLVCQELRKDALKAGLDTVNIMLKQV